MRGGMIGLRRGAWALAALLLAACESSTGGAEPVATLQAVPPAQFAAYAGAATAVYVRALDDDGDPVRGAVITWRVLEGDGTVSSDTSSTNALGVAGTTWTAGVQVGEAERLEAFHAGAESVVFTATPVTPQNVVITPVGSGQSAQVLTTLPNPVGVRVTLPDGRPVPGVPVTFTGVGEFGQITPLTTVTDAQGFARATWTLYFQARLYTIVAAVGNPQSPTAVQLSATATAGPPVRLQRIEGEYACWPAGDPVTSPRGVRLLDAVFNPVPGVQVNFDVPGDGFTTPASMVTDASGTARPQWTVRTRVGRDTLLVQVPAMGRTETFVADVCANAPVSLQIHREDGTLVDTVRVAVGQTSDGCTRSCTTATETARSPIPTPRSSSGP